MLQCSPITSNSVGETEKMSRDTVLLLLCVSAKPVASICMVGLSVQSLDVGRFPDLPNAPEIVTPVPF